MNSSQTAVVTGAASGIGRALATSLAKQGYRLVLADIDADRLGTVADELPASVAIVTDVGDPGSVEHLAAGAGQVDLVCLNAGVLAATDGAPWESGPEEWRHVLDVNLGGVVNGLRAFVPRLLARPEPSSLLITASLAGVATWPGGGPYAASKHATVAVAEQAALALADTHVSVTLLCPALVRTAMSDHGEDPMLVAERALEAVGSGRFAVMDLEWSSAVQERAARFLTGDQPTLPLPG